ncbi:hypothetical protein ACIGAN_29770 [Streptomyces sp. NPDC085931]|uniref:hypothetical protein n=1 Tax=Streptomyces sp. NPDC085931 TaxID=3365740 RepID=UPI0037D3A891
MHRGTGGPRHPARERHVPGGGLRRGHLHLVPGHHARPADRRLASGATGRGRRRAAQPCTARKETGEIDSDAPTLAEAGDTWAFTDPGQRAPALGEDRVTPREAGTYYQYAGVREVSADFRHTCQDGRTVVGRARTWTVDIAGVTGCGERPDTALAREAARRACGPAGAPATGP